MVYITTPAIPSCFMAFFSVFPFQFFVHLVYIEWLVTWCMYINEVYSVPVEPDLMCLSRWLIII